MLNQTITLWTRSGVDSNGDPSFGSPSQVTGRWEDRVERAKERDGTERVANAVIWLDQDVETGDYAFLGTSAAADPTVVKGARIVVEFRKIPNIDATKWERKALLL